MLSVIVLWRRVSCRKSYCYDNAARLPVGKVKADSKRYRRARTFDRKWASRPRTNATFTIGWPKSKAGGPGARSS